LTSVKGVSNGAKRTLRSWKLAWSARLRAAASRRESNDSHYFRQPGVALRAGFVMPRIMGEKEDAVRSLGFKRLAIFRPGIIAGNAHTPGFLALLGRFVPGSFGTIDQDDIGRAFVGKFLHGQDGTTILENAAMKQRSRAL